MFVAKCLFCPFLVVFCLFLLPLQSVWASTLEDVKSRDRLICGVDEQNFGFAYLDAEGIWQGFEVDFCRALAAAILNDPQKAQFMPLNTQTRFTALRDGQVDVLLRSTTWTYGRDTLFGFDFPAVTYYDRLGILAHKNRNVQNFDQISEGTLCVANATTTLDLLRQKIKANRKNIIIKVFNSRDGLNDLFFSGQCDFYAADHSALTATLYTNAPRVEDYVFLETPLSKEPLGPVVRGDDKNWHDIVRWLVFGLIEAEEIGITRQNLSAYSEGQGSAIDFLLGQSGDIGSPLGLSNSWLKQALGAVGNYGEIFERNLGQDSRFKMERGLNALWQNGGLMYAIPLR